MAGKCISLVKGRRIRLTRVNDCGLSVIGEGNQATSKGFISVAFTANTTDSDEISVQNAAGEVCVFEPSETSFTGYGVEISFCEVDVELFSLATGQDVYLDGNGDAIGFTVNTKIDRVGGFALELWAGSPGADVCVDPTAQGSYGYLLFPFIKGGIVGDFTIENGAATFTISGSTTRDGNGWGVGPYDVLQAAGTPAPLPTPLDTADHLLMVVTTLAPPDAVCGTRPVLDTTLPALTSIAGVVTGATADFDTTPASTGPVWWDFGDGEWDYVGIPGDASHTYDAAGTYTVKASQNGNDWATTTVTIAAVPAAPTFGSANPATGPEAGGTATVITGTNLTGVTGVRFGATPGTAFSVVNATTINVTSPAGTGTVDLVLLHPSGNVTATGAWVYTP